MIITFYEDWMKEQVVDLFVEEYKVTKDYFSAFFDQFYDAPYQKVNSIRLVALEDKTVIGFQSFFFWPFIKNNITYKSLQSGNSLIHKDHRGKGIFSKLLNFIDENKAELNIDFLIGFPIDASFNSLFRKGWINVFNLKWYIKIASFYSVLMPLKLEKFKQFDTAKKIITNYKPQFFKLSEDDAFVAWRKGYQNQANYFNYEYNEQNQKVQLCCKVQTRKTYIKEVIIGNILATDYNKELIKKAIQELFKKLKSKNLATIVSIALNENSNVDQLEVIKSLNFKDINKQIYFFTYPMNINKEELINPKNWELYRGDIDTW
jgi:GNAT superfamily N-acetyltransferase